MGGKVVPLSTKLDNAIAKYGDQFIRRNGDSIECSLCKKDIFKSYFSEASVATLVRQHVKTMKHRDSITNGGMVQVFNQRDGADDNEGSISGQSQGSSSSAKNMAESANESFSQRPIEPSPDVYVSNRPRRSVALYDCNGMKEESPPPSPPPSKGHKRRRNSKRESDEYREHSMALDTRIKELKIQKLEADIDRVNEERATQAIIKRGREEAVAFYQQVSHEIGTFFKSIHQLIDSLKSEDLFKLIPPPHAVPSPSDAEIAIVDPVPLPVKTEQAVLETVSESVGTGKAQD